MCGGGVMAMSTLQEGIMAVEQDVWGVSQDWGQTWQSGESPLPTLNMNRALLSRMTFCSGPRQSQG